MPSNLITRSVASLFVLPVLALACSAAPGDSASSGAVSEAVTDDLAGTRCSADEPCAAGYYCVSSSAANACGKGTCTASPQTCPMLDMPVCGCDGSTYLNSCWATIGNPGRPGTTSTGKMFVAPTTSALVGTWSRTSGSGSKKTVETLVLGSDASYTLNEETGCARGSSSACVQRGSAGTFSMSTVGILFDTTTSSNDATLATELYLENTCPIGGALQLVGAEPPGSKTMVTLSEE